MNRSISRWVTLTVLFATVGCEEDQQKKPFVTKARSQAVEADTETTKTAPAPATVASTEADPAAKKPRRLCDGQLGRKPMKLAETKLARASRPGAPELPEQLPLSPKGWTWINFWAAWCVPCREEIPRLKAWQKKLGSDGKFELLFVSLDDDERQLRSFLEKQSPEGLTASYWLKEEEQRVEWFQAVSMEPDPELPAHVLVDDTGQARCIVKGAVEDSDFEAVKQIVTG